jgi:hypothetical protein
MFLDDIIAEHEDVVDEPENFALFDLEVAPATKSKKTTAKKPSFPFSQQDCQLFIAHLGYQAVVAPGGHGVEITLTGRTPHLHVSNYSEHSAWRIAAISATYRTGLVDKSDPRKKAANYRKALELIEATVAALKKPVRKSK